MPIRLINLGLMIAFSFCYLAWGGGQSSFIYEIEYELFTRGKDFFETITHPVILIAFSGQILLLVCVIQPKPYPFLNHVGVGLSALIVAIFLLVSLLAMQVAMIASVLPFTILVFLYIRQVRLQKKHSRSKP